jgi:hypothetical protein
MGGTIQVSDPVESIPDPDTIRRKIGEASNRLALLRRLLRVSERKERLLQCGSNGNRPEAIRSA